MKNIKTIVAAAALTTVLTINSFGGWMIADLQSNESQRCVTPVKAVLNPTFNGVISYLTGVIVDAVKPVKECAEINNKGLYIAD
jgi:hypothetical protein